jgi:Leucine-rich repeat (LRR) protein
MYKSKFLVLKTKITENEENLKQQFFRRRRYRILVEHILGFSSVIDKLQLVKLNKNIFSIIKEKKYLDKIPAMISDLTEDMKYILRYYQHDLTKFVEMSYKHHTEDSHILVPIYFVKIYLNFLTNIPIRNKFLEIYNKKLSDLGAGCLAYYIKFLKIEKVYFYKTDDVGLFFSSFYFPSLDNLQSIKVERLTSPCNFEALTAVFNLKNLTNFSLENSKFLTKDYINKICNAMKNGLSKIENLSFEKCYLRDHEMSALVELIKNYPWLKKLNLSFNKFNDENLILFALNLSGSNLTYLDLRCNGIKSTFLRKFFLSLIKSRPKELKCLILYDNYAKSRAMNMMSKYISRRDCSLSELRIYTRCKTEDIEYFLAKIKHTSNLKFLDLTCHRIYNNIEQKIEKINSELQLDIVYGRGGGCKFDY